MKKPRKPTFKTVKPNKTLFEYKKLYTKVHSLKLNLSILDLNNIVKEVTADLKEYDPADLMVDFSADPWNDACPCTLSIYLIIRKPNPSYDKEMDFYNQNYEKYLARVEVYKEKLREYNEWVCATKRIRLQKIDPEYSK